MHGKKKTQKTRTRNPRKYEKKVQYEDINMIMFVALQ